MEVRTLAHTDLPTIVDCFIKAFADYFVKMPTEVKYFEQRWKAAMVSYEHSYGMFDGDALVGFVLHAVDTRFGKLTAFNDGTGVLPAYRNQRIVSAIYAVALPALQALGFELLSLEVIQQNHIAIKAYERVGFKKAKEYRCLRGTPQLLQPDETVQLEATTFDAIDWNKMPAQQYYAWEHQPNSLKGGNYHYYYLLRAGVRIGYFVITPTTGFLLQVECFKDTKAHWNAMLLGVSTLTGSVRINNIDTRQQEKLYYLEEHGLEDFIDQYVMEMPITPIP